MNTLKRLFDELVNLFPDQYMHMGSDETFIDEKCTLEGSLFYTMDHCVDVL